MKRKLSATLLLAGLAMSAQAVVIYDAIGSGTAFGTATGGVPRSRVADSMSFLNPGAGLQWAVTGMDIGVARFTGTFTTYTAEVILWNEWNGAGWNGSGTNVFRNEAGRQTFSLAPITASGPITVTFTTPILMSAFSNVGLEIQFKLDGNKNDAVSLSLQDLAPVVGSSTNLFYRDAGANEIIETGDGRTITGWTNTNGMIRIRAEAVPEPASLAALGLGAAALIRRRRRV